jgi:hypothetical protein
MSPLGAVGPPALAAHQIAESVAVQVRERQGMGLGKDDAVGGGFGARTHDGMAAEVDPAGLPEVLEPRQTPSVRVEGREDVGVPVAVDVVGEHLGAAFLGEGERVPGPFALPVGRLAVPALVQDQVDASVAIHVAEAFAVVEVRPGAFGGDRSEAPFAGGSGGIGADETPAVLPVGDQLGVSVAVGVGKRRVLALDAVEGEVFRPRAGCAFRVLVPERLVQVHPAEDQDVGPAVPIEVVDVTEHRVGRGRFGGKVAGGVKFEGPGEFGAQVDERTRHDIGDAVAVEVADRHAVAEVARGQRALFEADRRFRGRGDRGHGDQREKGEEGWGAR